MSSDFKQEFLKNKYEYISDDASNEPLKKTKKQKPKKSNHKHEYKNLIIQSYDKVTGKWRDTYVSYCTTCGKLSSFQETDEIAKIFPNIRVGTFGFCIGLTYNESNKEWQSFANWSSENIPHVKWKDFVYWKDKYIDLDLLNN